MASKGIKKKESKERVASAARTIPEHSVAPSVQGSQNEKDEKAKKAKQPIVIWPEWNEQDIGQEKWDIVHKAKEKEKGKSPNLHPYEDPEGRIDLPASITGQVDHWKRPCEFIVEKAPVVVDTKSLTDGLDLLSANDHLTHSELLRWIIGQVTCLWKQHFKVDPVEVRGTKDAKESNKGDKDKDKDKDKEKDKDALAEDNTWKPWGHIWPKEKTKCSALPVYNPGGKYCVRIFWMGAWRKVTVDDWMPFDEEGKLLLPATPNENELWPMLLSKALIKVASLDYAGGYNASEFGDFTVVHALTGWLPEIIPLRCGHISEIWKLLLQVLPRWKLENTPPPEEKKQPSTEGKKKDEKDKDRKSMKSDKMLGLDKGKDKDKDKGGTSTPAANSVEVPKEPEFVIFASYLHPPNTPMRHSVLKEMADASEKLRQAGLSHNHPHPIMLTTIRDCPLVPPPPPVQIPRWKLIRQKKKKQPVEPVLTPAEPPKDPQFLEVMSPFLNHKVSPIPVSRARTPVRWLKFRPEKPMGGIQEEGDSGEKKDGGQDQEEGLMTASGEKKDGVNEDPAAGKETQSPRQEGEETKSENDKEKETLKEGKDSRESLRERSITKDSSKTKDREKSAKGERGEKEKPSKTGDKVDKSRVGSKLSVVDKPNKSGVASPKGRRMSRMERPGADMALKTPPELRRVSRVEKTGKTDLERDSSHKVETILEDEIPSLDVPGSSFAEGDKTPGDATEREINDEKTEGDKTDEADKEKEESNKEKKIWMDYDDFCKCFRHLYIFHKPNTYSYSKGNSELKNVAMTSHLGKKSGLIPAASVTAATPGPGKGTGYTPSPYSGGHIAQNPNHEPPPPFLFVDSLKPIEIVVSFTALSKWLDPPQPIIKERDKEKESNSVFTEPKDVIAADDKPVPPTPGRLVAEPYSWKSLVTGQPILRICTTGTKASVLNLPPGRHVLRFLLQAPHGYHVEMASQTPFVYGDEDAVMACLTKESCRFLDHAMGVIQSVGNLVASFSDPPANRKFDLDLGLKDQPKDIQERHYQVFTKCLLRTVRYHLADSYDLAMHFAWKAFQFQASLCFYQRVGRRPLSAEEITQIGSRPIKRRLTSSAVTSTWVDRTSNAELKMAATKIQATFRGYFVRKLARAYVKGTDEHQKVCELLSKAWTAIEPNLESFAIQIFRLMFKRDPGLFPIFPFYKDEWSRVAYTDYNGAYPEQPPNAWFVVFREVFFVDEPVLMVPKLYISLPTCLLRVVDNDSGEELTRVFQKVAPNNLKKNKRGYTFVAEARTPNAILPPGKFRLRVIGSTEPLPYPARDGVNSHFINKEIRDYYIPNKYNIIFRYTVKVTEDHMVSLQLGTSKPDVYIKLQILDHEQEIASTTGKSHAVIPAFTFFRDRTGDEDEKQTKRGSRPPTSSQPRSAKRPTSGIRKVAASPVPVKGSKKSGKESSISSSRPGSSKASRPIFYDDSEDKEDEEPEETEPEIKIRKYIIQAQVLRDSWPLSKSAWDFVALLKSFERLDVDVPTESAPRADKLSASVSKGKKSKDGKENSRSKGQAGSRPSSQQQFDSSKPNWTLRVVSDANVDEIEVKKDTERQDEIKAMKQAWEAAEPGRAAKALQSRQKFLNEHMVKLEKDAIEEENGGDEEPHEEKDTSSSEIFTVTSPVQSETDQGELTLVPPPKEPDQILQPLTPPKTIRSRGGVPVLLDDEEKEARLQERASLAHSFKAMREEVVEKRREQDRLDRNAAKERQLQEAEEMQAALDQARIEINHKREAYRQKFLEAEKQKEEAQAAEAAKERERSPSPSKSRKSASTARGGRKSPGKGKKK
ncbi:androglobin-like isoform X1 [Montipora foliosa]|uniref:androglobin-like isoform X1 n=1 Tax=Montipora foliosa TaxID=591990 RepID=UPI0035F1F2A3